jgi:hypothetical protein
LSKLQAGAQDGRLFLRIKMAVPLERGWLRRAEREPTFRWGTRFKKIARYGKRHRLQSSNMHLHLKQH